MNTYLIPRKIGNENRILFFSPKSLIFFLIGVLIGSILMAPFLLIASVSDSVTWVKWIGIGINIIITVAFWAMGTFKIPESNSFEILKKAGGESVDVIAERFWKFRKNRKIYLYKGGNKEDGNIGLNK